MFLSHLVFSSFLILHFAAIGQDSAERTQQIAEELRPSLVRIHVVESAMEEGHEVRHESYGSGVIITSGGCIVTNHHVAGKAIWLSVTLSDKSEVEAKLVGTDPLADVAVIQLNHRDGKSYKPAKWGDSSKLRVGERVLAMGCPFALSQSVTSGVVSNAELILPPRMGEEMDLDGEDVGSIVRWIGHDAQIHPGNSGGPLVNLSGEIVGINELNVGLSAAIPSKIARPVAEQILKEGRVKRAYLGIEIQPRLSGGTETTGALVGGVYHGSPAEKAGVLAGDLLLSVGDIKFDTRYDEEVPLANLQITSLEVGKPVPVRLKRAGKDQILSIVPGNRTPAIEAEHELTAWGLTATNLTESLIREGGFDSRDGVLVTGIAGGGVSAEAQPPLAAGDIIVRVGGQTVKNLAGLQEFTAKLPHQDGGVSSLVEFTRKGEHILTLVNVGRAPTEDGSVELAHAWLPVETQVLTAPLAEALKIPEGTKGVRITKIYPEAHGLGLQVGDIVTGVGGLEIDVNEPEDNHLFNELVRQFKIDSTVKLTGFRSGSALTVSVKLTKAKKQTRELPRYIVDGVGFSIREPSYQDTEDSGQPKRSLLVADLVQGSWAALAGLLPGDMILSIDHEPVVSLAKAKAKLIALKSAKARIVVLFVSRDAETHFVEVRTGWDIKS